MTSSCLLMHRQRQVWQLRVAGHAQRVRAVAVGAKHRALPHQVGTFFFVVQCQDIGFDVPGANSFSLPIAVAVVTAHLGGDRRNRGRFRQHLTAGGVSSNHVRQLIGIPVGGSRLRRAVAIRRQRHALDGEVIGGRVHFPRKGRPCQSDVRSQVNTSIGAGARGVRAPAARGFWRRRCPRLRSNNRSATYGCTNRRRSFVRRFRPDNWHLRRYRRGRRVRG